ncbi:carbon-nitrogen hydrolase family protein [Thalassolituus sp. LLYu03]|uniref:carbon-nitrogen hydrolase family protein n=1 Tax=Thalassolituus sp. LLYu03 TaxID=3421656 RepID=UPI003D2BE8BF
MGRIAAIQISSQPDIEQNLSAIAERLADAAAAGAVLALLPEMALTLDGRQYQAIAADSQYPRRLGELAAQHGIWLVAGAVPMPCPDGDPRVRSATLVFNDQGHQIARYDKIHLFDVDVGDAHGSYRESERFAPGDELVVVDTPAGKLGLAICYDLRFPELFHQLRARGADILSLPAAFTYTTGEAHWQVLLRARAIETQCYVLAANQCGWHDDKRQTWGHSQIIDPWGRVLTELGHEPGVALADTDAELLADIRRKMPVMAHKRV